MKTSIPSLSSISLKGMSQYVQLPDCHPVGTRVPPFFERVELMTGGRGWIPDGETWREVVAGDLIWNKPGDSTIRRSDFKNPYRCLSITLITQKSRGLGLPRFTRWPALSELRSFSEETVRLFKDETFDRHELLSFVLHQLLFRVRVHHHQTREDELPTPLRNVLNHLERTYWTPCPISELATVAEWSTAHLHDMFQKHLGSSPHQWLIRHRLKMAREKLESSLQPIKQISAECGFADTAAFTHSFKAGVGQTPTQYRKRYQRLLTA